MAAPTQDRARGLGTRISGKGVAAGGSLLGAIAASSCCILPLVLFSLGASGAWIGNLAALYPYKMYFLVVTAGFLACGFWLTRRRPRTGECAAQPNCASPRSDGFVKTALWTSTLLVLAALAFPYVAPGLLGV